MRGRLARFVLTGAVNTGTYYASYLLLHLVMPYLAAHVLAFAVATVGSYLLNCWFTFKVRPTWRKLFLFPLSSLANFVVITVGLYVMVGQWHVSATVAPLIAAAIAVPVTFLLVQYILVDRHTDAVRQDGAARDASQVFPTADAARTASAEDR